MTKMILSGLSGSVDLTVSDGLYTAQRTQNVPGAARPEAAATAAFVIGEKRPHSAPWRDTVTGGVYFGNGVKRTGDKYEGPRIMSFEPAGLTQKTAATDTIITQIMPKMEHYGGSVMDGGWGLVTRIENGAVRQVRKSKIISGNHAMWRCRDGRAIAETSMNYKFRGVARDVGRFWFAVAAIDSNGVVGAFSNGVYYDRATKDNSGTEAARTKVKSVNKQTASEQGYANAAGLPAPVMHPVAENATYPTMLDLSWDAVTGAAGYVFFESDDDPAVHTGDAFAHYVLEADGGEALKVGDYVVVTNEVKEVTPQMIANTAYNSGLPLRMTHMYNEDLNNHFKWLDFDANNVSPDPKLSFHARRTVGVGVTGSDHNVWNGKDHPTAFYEILTAGRYWVRFWYRANRSYTCKFQPGISPYGYETLNVTTSWQFFEKAYDCDGPSASNARWSFVHEPTGSSVQFDFTPVRITDDGYELHALTQKTLAMATAAQSANARDILHADQRLLYRDHGFIKAELHNKPMRRLLSAPEQEPSLISTTKMILSASMDPWYQVEQSRPAEEWPELIAFLCAPYDPASTTNHPMAVHRANTISAEPLIGKFKAIYFEFGNESWNNDGAFWRIPSATDAITGESFDDGTHFGLFVQFCIDAMKTSPWWADFRAKTKFVIGGRNGNDYGQKAFNAAPDADILGIANYFGRGWDVQGSDLQYMRRDGRSYEVGLNHWQSKTGAYAAIRDGIVVTGEPEDHLAIYEGGVSYSYPGQFDKGIEYNQETVNKSRALATATVANWGEEAYQGFTSNWFGYGGGDNWAAWSNIPPNATYPSYGMIHHLFRELNEAYAHEVVEAKIASHYIPGDTVARNGVKVHALRSVREPGKWAIMVSNLRIDRTVLETDDPYYDAADTGAAPILLGTPFSSITGLRGYLNVGNMRHHNRYKPGEKAGVTRDADGNIIDYIIEPDATCVTIDIAEQVFTPPADPGFLLLDGAYGVPAGGLPGGNSAIYFIDGAVI